ncbi:uncharacterized protein LOC115746807 isoform X2 [Rhodamnia argentea]|uniref:Uncharacterized protein LOC115746807 isoform X2 n=1 Tax=Rhodamnia argentea TaxID=178133 RepID=A0ABM3HN77_9MYRT|nr:uncharacterized protein LOC115746807 isoform X2 [Rhodamnia argentea]
METKKRSRRKKLEVPMEAKEKVERMMSMRMFSHLPGQEIYRALEACDMDFIDAMLRLSNLERKENGDAEGGGGGDGEGRRVNAAEGSSRACADCQSKKQSTNVEWTPSPSFINLLEKEKRKNRAGPPAEWEEQIQRVNEILKQCRRDPKLAAKRLFANWLEFEAVKTKREKEKATIDAQQSKSQHEVSSSVLKQGGSRDDDVGRTDTTQADTNARSQFDNVSSPLSAAVSSVASQPHHLKIGKGKMKKVAGSTNGNAAVVSRSHVPPLRAVGPLGIYASGYSPIQPPERMLENAPPYTPSASIHQSSQTLLRGNNLSTGHGFTHPYVESSYYQPQLPLQHGYMNSDEYMHQNFGYDMTSPQQEVYRGGSSSWANANPSGWGSFPSRGSTPQSHQFLPNSPAPSDSSRTQLDSALHVEAQRQHRNDYFLIGMYYNFATQNNQLDPGAVSALPEQQQGGFPGWVPLPSNGNNQHIDMPSAQQELNQGGGSSRANASTSGWGSIQGTGSTCSQSPPMPSHSPAPFNNLWTSHDPTLEAQDQYRNDHPFSIFPGPASTPHGHFPRWVPLPANGRNQHAGEGSAPQYVYHGWHHPGTHQQQSPYNTSTGNLQDLSTVQPPQDPGPQR